MVPVLRVVVLERRPHRPRKPRYSSEPYVLCLSFGVNFVEDRYVCSCVLLSSCQSERFSSSCMACDISTPTRRACRRVSAVLSYGGTLSAYAGPVRVPVEPVGQPVDADSTTYLDEDVPSCPVDLLDGVLQGGGVAVFGIRPSRRSRSSTSFTASPSAPPEAHGVPERAPVTGGRGPHRRGLPQFRPRSSCPMLPPQPPLPRPEASGGR